MTKQEKEYNKVEVDVKVDDKDVEEVVIEREPIKPVAKAKPRKKGLAERLVVGLIGNAEQEGALKYIGKEIIMPSVKDLSYNAIQSLASSLLYGQDGQPPRTNSYSTRPASQRTNYQGAYGSRPQTAPTAKPKSVRQDVDDYILETRQDAVMVLESLIDQCERYGSVSIADYYDLVGVDSTYTQGKYGWSDLSRARVITNRHGFTIAFPPVELI